MPPQTSHIQYISTALVTDKPVRKTPYQVKGSIMKNYPKSEIVPMLNGSYRKKYLYPRVQVKILNEKIYFLGIAEGVSAVRSLIDNFKSSLGVYLHLKIDFIKRNPKSGAVNPFVCSDTTANDHTDFCCFGQI